MTTPSDSPRPDRAASDLPSIRLLSMPLHALNERQAVDYILDRLAANAGGWLITPNLDHLRRYHADGEFASHYGRADVILADGMPLVWAARLQGSPLPQRVPGSGLIFSLSEAVASEDRSIFLLGGDPGTAEAAAEELQRLYPRLRISGIACPAVGFEKCAVTTQALRKQIAQSGADVVFVALGSPKQEQTIDRLRDALPAAWWLGVGISFSFVSGRVRRAPRWMQRCGLEWTHRLAQEPRRLARRYLIDDLPFAAVLFTEAARQRLIRSVDAFQGSRQR